MLIAAAIARVPAVVATAHLLAGNLESGGRIRDRFLASTVDRYIVVSNAMTEKLRRYLSIPLEKICLVRNGVSLRGLCREPNTRLREELASGTNAKIALVVARLARHKGHRYLL